MHIMGAPGARVWFSIDFTEVRAGMNFGTVQDALRCVAVRFVLRCVFRCALRCVLRCRRCLCCCCSYIFVSRSSSFVIRRRSSSFVVCRSSSSVVPKLFPHSFRIFPELSKLCSLDRCLARGTQEHPRVCNYQYLERVPGPLKTTKMMVLQQPNDDFHKKAVFWRRGMMHIRQTVCSK